MTKDQASSAQPSLLQQAVPNSPVESTNAGTKNSYNTPTSDQGDQPPPPRRSSHRAPTDRLQPTLVGSPPKPDEPESRVSPTHHNNAYYSTTNSNHHHQKLHQNASQESSDNSYEEEITQEFEAYRQEYLLANNKSKQERSSCSWWSRCFSLNNNNNKCSRMCQVILIAVALQVLTLIIFTVVYVSFKNKQQNSSSEFSTSGTPLGEYHGGTFLPSAPDNITSVCTLEKIEASRKGLEDCLDLCRPSSCCHFSHLEPDSCWTDNVEACHAYEAPCNVLNRNPTTVPPQLTPTNNDDITQSTVYPNAVLLWEDADLLPDAPDFLWETCQAALVLSSEWQSSETSMATLTCQETCEKARCCWDTSLNLPADRCWTHPNCDHYIEACNVIAEPRETIADGSFTGGFVLSVPPVPARLSAFCRPDNIENNLEDLLACHEACLAAECCWNDALLETERCTYDEQCPNYVETCSVLMNPFYPPSSLSEGGGAPTDNGESGMNTASDTTTDGTLEDYPPAVIWDACYNHDNNIPLPDGSGASLCEKLCAPGSCCYNPSFSGCPTSYAEDYCDRFRPCQVLVDDQHTPESYVEEACNNFHDLSECVELCASATCCFTKDLVQECVNTHPDIRCSSYTACEVLYSGFPSAMADTDSDGDTIPDQNRRLLLRGI